jgi:hypothetical protein
LLQACADVSEVCSPVTSEPGFKQCILQYGTPGTVNCPTNYPEKSVFYSSPVPSCSPCTCGIPTAGSCAGSISISQDDACGAPLLPKVSIDLKGPTCVDLPPGSGLGSKLASKPSYVGGYCQPSAAAPEGTIFCCLP